MIGDKKQAIVQVLDGLAATPGVSGSLILTRDGLCVVNAAKNLPRPETFAAMAAACVGAAETALAEFGETKTRLVTVQASESNALVFGATAELLLAVVVESKTDLQSVTTAAEATAQKIAALF